MPLGRFRLLGFALIVVLAVTGCSADSGGQGFTIPEATSLLPPTTPSVPRGVQNDFRFIASSTSRPSAPDWNISGGHFFTETGGGAAKGYAVLDDSAAKFWTEFQKVGGVEAVGYPVSQRFQWDGFTDQAFQRVIFQWHPDTQSVSFVNTFDRLHELGKDDWLFTVRQTPRPIHLNEQGESWEQIEANRLALLDASPPIKAKYYQVVGDPVQANGLPTSAVTDMGNHFALRAQRVEFQLWKEDVPWAKAGTVTVALGGDIAKEAGVLPDVTALQAQFAPGSTSSRDVQYSTHRDDEKVFEYPAGWQPQTLMRYGVAHNYYVSPSGAASMYYLAKYNMGPNFKLGDFVNDFVKAMAGRGNFSPGEQQSVTIDGHPAILQWYTTGGDHPVQGVAMVLQNGQELHYLGAFADVDLWPSYEPYLMECIKSYTIP